MTPGRNRGFTQRLLLDLPVALQEGFRGHVEVSLHSLPSEHGALDYLGQNNTDTCGLIQIHKVEREQTSRMPV